MLKPGGKLVLAEYEIDYSKTDERDLEIRDIFRDYGGAFGLDQISVGKFQEYIHKAGFSGATEDDWTKGIYPSALRLERMARPFTKLALKLKWYKIFINSLLAWAYAESIRKKVFYYKAFSAIKPKSK